MELTVDKELFRLYTLCAGLLMGKTIIMSIITARARFAHHVFANPEDGKHISGRKTAYDNPHVERTRRAHQNDIENIYAFILISALYLLAVKPSYFIAKCLFMGFTSSRFIHTIVYLYEIQPFRALAWAIGWFINMFMVGNILYSVI